MGKLTNDMKQVVEEQRLGFVATINPDGTPNLSPKGTMAVLDDDHLVFADLASPQTVENIRSSPAVEVNVVDAVTRTGYRFKGRGRAYGDGPRFYDLLGFFADGPRAVPGWRERIHHVVVIELERCLPLISPAYDSGATGQEISERWEAYFRSLWARRSEPPPGT